MKKSLFAIALLVSATLVHAEDEEQLEAINEALDSNFLPSVPATNPDGSLIPCPAGWTVSPNPTLDNSLSYLSDSGALAINVTSLKQRNLRGVGPENYARVSALQMNCQLPNKSNLLENAWAFFCPEDNIEALVYGDNETLVLLSISGRNQDTEVLMEEFIDFLADQAKR